MNLLEEIKNPPDPIAAFESLQKRPYAFFLDSACDHGKLGRFSFMGCDPFLVFKAKGDSISLEWSGGIKKTEHFKSDPFTALESLLKSFEVRERLPGLPLMSGAVGYFSYDMKNFLEDLPDAARDDTGIPDCMLGFYDAVIAYDHLNGTCFVAGRTRSSLKELRKKIKSSYGERRARRAIAEPRLRSNFTKAAYIRAVRKAKEYIRKGDIYQVNISQRFEATLDMSPLELYRRLRSFSPAPFAAYLGFDDVTILSSSPERFLFKKESHIETRPIKGTRPRGSDAVGDIAMERELAASAKDMAEHIMIVDLERNDLGRICEFGSVRPTESAVIEKYANVFHLVSTVAGTLKNGVSSIDCLRATFPGGSITGAPKIRSMEIIDELEDVRRSVYTGALGYIGFDGTMDMSIVIRTFVIKGKSLYFQVGGGIVADSDPEKEYEETLHKARGLMQALGIGVHKTETVKV
jgi:para-aminobenzoate synthetase component 1